MAFLENVWQILNFHNIQLWIQSQSVHQFRRHQLSPVKLMGNINKCDECQQLRINKDPKQIILIQKELEQFANLYKINKIPRKIRTLIQKSFMFGHKHISIRIIQLYNQKKNKEQPLLTKIQQIDLQELDQLYHLTKFNEYRCDKISSYRPVIQIDEKYRVEGKKAVDNREICFVAFVDCFMAWQLTKQTELTSRKTSVELFYEKIQAYNILYNQIAKVIIVCSQSVKNQVAKVVGNYASVVPFKSSIPLISKDGQIYLFGDDIKFHDKMGDAINFLCNLKQLREKLEQVAYIQFCDVSNLISPLVDCHALGYLKCHSETSCMIELKEKGEQSYGIINKFIEFTEKQIKELGNCIISKQYLLSTKSNNNYQVFGQRIKKQRSYFSKNQYYFVRMIHNILMAENTKVYRSREWATSSVQYSNFCKDKLDIENQCEDDLVEISLDIVFGGNNRLEEIKEALVSNLKEVGFPLLILKKQNQSQ